MSTGEDLTLRKKKRSKLRRSVSSFGMNMYSLNTSIREAKSLTGALHDLKTAKLMIKQRYDPNYYLRMLKDSQPVVKENEYITKEISTDRIFIVKEEMLNHRGTQYTLNDIATRWKKDCRMWLWKNGRRSQSIADIHKKMESLNLPALAEAEAEAEAAKEKPEEKP